MQIIQKIYNSDKHKLVKCHLVLDESSKGLGSSVDKVEVLTHIFDTAGLKGEKMLKPYNDAFSMQERFKENGENPCQNIAEYMFDYKNKKNYSCLMVKYDGGQFLDKLIARKAMLKE